MNDYRTALRVKGVRPIPAYSKLRTAKSPGHFELVPVRSKHCKGIVEHVPVDEAA